VLVGGSKGKCVATKAKFSLICTTGNSKTYITYITSVDSKNNHFICIFWRSNISRGNDKLPFIITASEADKSSVSKPITVTVPALNDVAPTNIQISNTNLLKGQPAGTVVGTLSATDTDTAYLHFLAQKNYPSW
jgi:hypothetical protein